MSYEIVKSISQRKKDNKILMVKEAKENFNGNVYVPNDLDEIIL